MPGSGRLSRSGGKQPAKPPQLPLNRRDATGSRPPTTPTPQTPGISAALHSQVHHELNESQSPGPDAESSLRSHPLYEKFKSLPTHLYPFLRHDWEQNRKLTCLLYYDILRHFDPDTKARPKHLKAELVKRFRDDLRPKILLFCTSAPPTRMETDANDSIDFDPKGRRTTKLMLVTEIKRRRPDLSIPLSTNKEGLLYLFKHYVDPGLRVEPSFNYTRIPRRVASNSLSILTMDELRFGLQTHAPQIFLHLNCVVHKHLISLYKIYVLEEPVDNVDLVEGYHYSTILDMPQSAQPSPTMKE